MLQVKHRRAVAVVLVLFLLLGPLTSAFLLEADPGGQRPSLPMPEAPQEATAVPVTEAPAVAAENPSTAAPVNPTESPVTAEPVAPTESPATAEPAVPTEVPATAEPAGHTDNPVTAEPAGPAESPATEAPAQSPAPTRDRTTEAPAPPATDPGAPPAATDTPAPEIIYHLVRFFSPNGQELFTLRVQDGRPLDKPRDPLPPAGSGFVRWYVVNDKLEGDSRKAFDFNTPITKPLLLMAYFQPVADATDVPALEASPEQAVELAASEAPPTDAPEIAAAPAASEVVPTDKLEAPAESTAEPKASDSPAATPEPSDMPATDVPEETADPTAEPTTEPELTDAPDTEEPAPSPAPEGDLISETDVSSYLVRFYGAQNEQLFTLTASRGQPLARPEDPAAPEGQAFAHWYAVDQQLVGDSAQPYDFAAPIAGLTWLKAHFVPLATAEPAPTEEPAAATETPLPTDAPESTEAPLPSHQPEATKAPQPTDQPEPTPEQSPAVTPEPTLAPEPATLPVPLNITLSLAGKQIEDGAFTALLTGPGLPEGGVATTNTGDVFPFAPLPFTATDVGTHSYTLQAVVADPQPGFTYDMQAHPLTVTVAADPAGALSAVVRYPDGQNGLQLQHLYSQAKPVVRVFLRTPPGREVALGDTVRFTAITENCGHNPLYHWQYSTDNATWQDITGATQQTLDILLTPANAGGYWRVGVTIGDAGTPDEP